MSVTPNQNPNTVYLIGGDQPIPVGLEDCFVINNTYLNEEEFHIEDGYPVTNKIRGSRIDYQLHFNDDEWMLLGSPFDMVLDTDALAQLDEVMTFDRFQDNTLYFKKYDKNLDWSIWNQPQVKARYATDGRAVGSGYRGIVVEVDGNGKARKVVRR